MAQEHWNLVREIFVEAVAQDPSRRLEFVRRVSDNDEEVRNEVESLLRSYVSADSFMESPAIVEIARFFDAGIPQVSSGEVFGHYEIVKQIGRGGMGEVYLAVDTVLGRKVAIKILDEKYGHRESNLRRFVQEAKAASSLNHPNILVIYEIGEKDGTRFIVSEYVEGLTLRDVMRSRPLEVAEVLEYSLQVASALSAAHAAHIIHRDIKPENIMIRPDGLAKILDFGLAKLVEDGVRPIYEEESGYRDRTDRGKALIMGTVSYMSPEQAKGRQVDARTDVFSFGVLLYELLTGVQPFSGDNVEETIVAIYSGRPLPLSTRIPNAPPELERIVAKLLEKNPLDRYQQIGELQSELQELKQELEFAAKLDRTKDPVPRVLDNHTDEVGAVTHPVSARLSDPAGRAISGIGRGAIELRRHKLLSLTGISVAAMALGVFAYLGLFPGNADRIESVAVMPFVDASEGQDNQYLAEGMTETLISGLSHIPNLSVKARSAVFRFKGKDLSPKKIGEELNVQAVLLGRILAHGEDLQLNLELVDTRTQDVIWNKHYERRQSELVVLQSDIARDVASELRSQLSGSDRERVTRAETANPEAYQAYLRGRYYWNRRLGGNMTKAIDQFKIATEADPNFALAWVGLADCFALSNEYVGTPNPESLPKSIEYANRAIALDPRMAEPHTTLGYVYRLQWRWAESEREFKRAIELDPNYATTYHWYSVLLRDLGRFDEAMSIIERGHEIDPLSSVIAFNLSKVYDLKGRHQESIENTKKVIELDPTVPMAYTILGRSLMQLGQNEEAVRNFEKAATLSNRDRGPLSSLGYAYAITGKRNEAVTIAKELERKYQRGEANGIYASIVYAGLGDKDKAFEWFAKDIDGRGEYGKIRWEFGFESLRGDPRYKELLEKLGLSL